MRVGLEHAVHVMHASFRGKHSIYQVPLFKGYFSDHLLPSNEPEFRCSIGSHLL